MVEESLDKARSDDMRLKLILKIRADCDPLLNCHNFFASGTENTRTTVPLSDAVASIVPVALRARHAIGVLCAWMTLIAERLRVSKRRTSPVVGAGGAAGTAEDDKGDDEADGAGEG